jgi:DNA repair exonuclease SbcCD ATPase subunit
VTRSRLLSIKLEAFRGFAVEQEFDLDADVVLIRGDNGTGKTALSDGLLWLCTGKIPRLTERAKGLRKAEDPVICRYRPNGPARVTLGIRLIDGSEVTFRREGGADRSTLSAWRRDAEVDNAARLLAEALGLDKPDHVTEAINTWGILQQHAMLAALDAGATLHQRLAEVVGLEHVTRFAAAATETTKRLRAELKQVEASAQGLRQRRTGTEVQLLAARSAATAQRPRLPELLSASLSELPEGVAAHSRPAELEEVAKLGREVGAVLEATRDVVTSAERAERAERAASEAVDHLEAELASLMQRAEAAVQRAPAQVQLAGAALTLLDGDTCPVCGQRIDEASVRQHLTELLQTAHAEASSAAEAQRAVADAQARLATARNADARRKAARQELDDSIAEVGSRLAEAKWLSVDSAWLTAARSDELASALDRWRNRLREVFTEGRRDASGEVARLASDTSAIDAELERVSSEVQQLQDRVRRAATLEGAARQAAERIIERALKRLQPSFSEVYDRLSPHPTFTELRATQDIYYNKNQVVPEVWDPERGVGGNPAQVLSEGQLNVVALSYFLGLALNAGSGALPFLALDDPLQAMDVLSVLGFADLCRRIREHRQLIVTTHDRRFAAVLERKLAPREPGSRTVLHEFEGWTEDGPIVKSSDEPLADVIPLPGRQAS